MLNFNRKSTSGFMSAYVAGKCENHTANTYADWMKNTMLDVMKSLREAGLIFKKTTLNGNEADISAACACDYNDATDTYYNKAWIGVANQKLIIYGGTKEYEENGVKKVRLTSIAWNRYNKATESSTTVKGIDDIMKTRGVNDGLKKIAQYLVDNGFITNAVHTEMSDFCVMLNKEVFTGKIQKKDENGETTMVKTAYALYKNDPEYGESITIWNRHTPMDSEDFSGIVVTLSTSMEYGHSVKITNLDLTEVMVEGGKYEVQPRDRGDGSKPLWRFINSTEDEAAFVPERNEFYKAIELWKPTLSYNAILELKGKFNGEEYEEILSDGEVPF